ncbi:hypothetical protein ACEWPL_014620 [Roseovarius sp. S1116L3]|uniref:hypothetical protein n=1 Tax=Roseovarius roseus TaxID=3342636 RepID=UPI00372C0966
MKQKRTWPLFRLPCSSLREHGNRKKCLKKNTGWRSKTSAAVGQPVITHARKKGGAPGFGAAMNSGANKETNMSNFHLKSTKISQDESLNAVRAFFSKHGEAAQNASLLLGGATAYRRCLRLLSSLRDAPILSRHLKHELVQLHRLLMLDPIGDPDALETKLFLEIHPADPIVEDLCMLADQLFDLLEVIGANSDEQEARAALAEKQTAA